MHKTCYYFIFTYLHNNAFVNISVDLNTEEENSHAKKASDVILRSYMRNIEFKNSKLQIAIQICIREKLAREKSARSPNKYFSSNSHVECYLGYKSSDKLLY